MSEEAVGGRWRDLGVRFTSAAILIPAVLLDVWAGSWWFTGFIGLLTVLAAREYVRMTAPGNWVQLGLHAAAGLCATLPVPLLGPASAFSLALALWVVSAALYALEGRKDAFSLLGAGYVALPGLALVALRDAPAHGSLAIYWLFAVVWSADTFAYFFGRVIGGPKLWPAVSPKKTWAGLLGAVCGAMAASLLVMWFAGAEADFWLTAIAGFLGVVEQGGDLYESALKRRAGVKDSGSLIPGHGGLLDRVDGLLAAALAAWILVVISGG